jgi:hypothetical protein
LKTKSLFEPIWSDAKIVVMTAVNVISTAVTIITNPIMSICGGDVK